MPTLDKKLLINESASPSSKWDTFTHRAKDAVRKTLLSTTMVAGLSAPTSAMTSLSDKTSSQLASVVRTDDPIDDADVMDYILEAKNSNISTINKVRSYSPMQLNFLSATDILPIVGQVEAGDKKAYEHIEHLGVAEATKIRDMMREYWAWSYTPEQYQQLMARLHTGMTMEEPEWYDNYEHIWWNSWDSSDHATEERNILNSLIDDKANFIVQNKWDPRWWSIKERVDANPNNIYIFWNSTYWESDKARWLTQNSENLKENLARSKNFLIFVAWWNIREKNENWQRILKNKIYHEDINWDKSDFYKLPSAANWTENKDPNNHIVVTVWTNKDWDITQTNEIYESSKMPIWFHNKSLFAGRIFPYIDASDWQVGAESGKYATSYPNYVNVAMADLCFQMRADVADVDELLDRMRATALTDYIRLDLNWDGDTDDIVQVDTDDGHIDQPETQHLQLISPAWYFVEYNLPTNLPSEILSTQTLPLDKWYYKGVVFNIPGAEVCINNDEWIPFDESNRSLIMDKNPMLLNWRLNGSLLKELWYKKWDTISWTIQAVDDKWNGLNHLNKTFSFTLNEDVSGIDGKKLPSAPTTPGIYIRSGKKVVVK